MIGRGSSALVLGGSVANLGGSEKFCVDLWGFWFWVVP